jgi:L-ascorbate metabolism protein UlaG (beta-lactamase superfamily)
MSLSITWLGHSSFLLGLPNGKRLVIDPWLTNPNCPAAFARPEALKPVDLILCSHGHSDHLADVASIARVSGAPVVCLFELGLYLTEKGLQNVKDMAAGGTQEVAGIRITMTQAVHSGAVVDDGKIVYLGGAAGFILRAPGVPTIYFAGDTALFGDMKVLRDLYHPEIAFLPIGDHYTMGPFEAAHACRLLGVSQVAPGHWGTFGLLTGTPGALREELAKLGLGDRVTVLDLEPGQTLA